MATPAETPRRTARGKNPNRSREHNRRVVLDLLRTHGRTGRRELAELTQLTPQAVTNIIEDLIAADLIVTAGRRREGRGRGQPPHEYEINPAGAFTIGVELAVTRMVTTVVDLAGTLLYQDVTPIEESGPDALLPAIGALVDRLRTAHPGRLMGLGLVMPGPFEIEGFSGVGPTTLPGWAGIDVAAELRERLGVPVVVENDANAAAVGETLLGVGRDMREFCVVYFGTGIGLGLISEGRPMRGAFGNAGEIGHIVVAPGGRPCPCGQNGCLERYASLHALRERLADAGRSLPAEDLGSLDPDGDPVVAAWLEDAAAHLSPMISILENVLDPETIILSGGLPTACLDAIIGRLSFGPSVARRSDRAVPPVIRGQSGLLTAALGAAALPMHDAITPRLELSELQETISKGANP
ncbi:ROK family transcriptional regulator [Roseicyclus sp. F158]|uniref:ROK family transcriptional regulator n=1 Tax=Tropicimonas omnivorans TaxID=3075590 RepID=A0ABU3DC39_9RHOB|nr:ROK family transcriptional regulator [Roseicyclus sp. F158]MDT0681275.1 ROK family transcriptional regulator [Roseicyclus sp. F158]